MAAAENRVTCRGQGQRGSAKFWLLCDVPGTGTRTSLVWKIYEDAQVYK